MQVFVTKTFDRWMRKSRLREERILLTALETFSGLSVVDLGAGLIKKLKSGSQPLVAESAAPHESLSPRASTVGIFFFTGFIKMSVQI